MSSEEMSSPQTLSPIQVDRSTYIAGETGSYYRWYVLTVLLLVYACHTIDRYVVAVLVEPVKKEFVLTDSQVGFLTGFAYAITFMICAIPAGFLIDRMNRRNLLASLVVLWSAMTALGGVTQTFTQLVAARMSVAVFESGGNNTPMSMIADLFPKSMRQTAMGIYITGIPLGSFIGFLVGSYIASTSGWRKTLFLAGIPGILLALLLLLTVREPKRGTFDAIPGGEAPPLRIVARFMVGQQSLLTLLLAITLCAIPQSGVLAWMGSLFIRVYHLPLKETGFVMAVFFGAVSGIGTFFGGMLVDWIAKSDSRRIVWCLAAAALVLIPVSATMFIGLEVNGVIALLVIWSIISMALYGPAYGLVQSLVPSRMRGTTTAILLVANNVVGLGFGPQLVGSLSDAFSFWAGTEAIRYALMSISVFYMFAAYFYLRTAKTLDRDLARVAAPN